MSNPLNTEFVQSIVGFTLDDVLKIEPFKDAYSTGWFVIFMTFIGAVLVLMGIALLYSLCDCVCSCCRRSTTSGRHSATKNKNRVHNKGENAVYENDLAY